ncbi:hypothetical protein [Mucilaginibacter celer]|uniref:Uncharacterized protein n=1 Tax=Mucilaginibacter celer TaxID=2305508 RepID=A0A494VX11_9SPHI|nr:hypothetical protein [Mucilaginibacter celer]AYL95858.1 hypothetical protein HYN43_011410 [Mucilaginibacter celer]
MKSEQINNNDLLLDVKVNELVLLLQSGDLDKEHIKAAQQKINNAIDTLPAQQSFDAFKELDGAQDRLAMVTNLELLLTQHQVDSRQSKKYLLHEKVKRVVLIAIAITMAVLGLAMIIMPAPPYFEMFTIFYFSKDDGITLMDVISVLILLTGVYLFLNAVLKKANP